jgi:hypothetical protein
MQEQLQTTVLKQAASVSTQTYSIVLDSFQVAVARSGSLAGLDKGNDSDYVGLTIQVNNAASQTQTKFMGNNCSGGNTYGVDVAFNSVTLADTDAVAIISAIVNSSAGESEATTYLESALSKLASKVGSALGNALTKDLLTDAVKQEIGAAVGAAIGTVALPVLGSALGAIGGFLAGEAWGIAFPNCDGPVAASMFLYSGAELKALVTAGKPLIIKVNNPGIDSAHGCGANSVYNVNYSIALVSTHPGIPNNIKPVQLTKEATAKI